MSSRSIEIYVRAQAPVIRGSGIAWLSLVVALLLSACGTAASIGDRAPEYAAAGKNLRSFSTTEELAQYLRSDSETGPLLSAHRGGAMPAFPENCIATLERTLRYAPALLEVDIRMSRDSILVLMHDDTLDRTTNGKGPLEAVKLSELRRLLLRDVNGIITPFRIPTLAEVLAWSQNRAIVQLDVKEGVPPELLVEVIRRHGAQNRVVVLVYDLEQLVHYSRMAPELVYSAVAETIEQAEAVLTHPDVDPRKLMAWTGLNEVNDEVIAYLRRHQIRAVVGTFELIDKRATEAGPEVYGALFDRGVGVVATDLIPLAAQALPAQR